MFLVICDKTGSSFEITVKTVSIPKLIYKTCSSPKITVKTVSTPKITHKTGSSIDKTLKIVSSSMVDERKNPLSSEITINVVEVKSAGNQSVQLKCKGNNLDKMDWFGKSDPYFEIWCGSAMIYRSEVVECNLNPNWKLAIFPFSRMEGFCSFDVKVFDWDGLGDNNRVF